MLQNCPLSAHFHERTNNNFTFFTPRVVWFSSGLCWNRLAAPIGSVRVAPSANTRSIFVLSFSTKSQLSEATPTRNDQVLHFSETNCWHCLGLVVNSGHNRILEKKVCSKTKRIPPTGQIPGQGRTASDGTHTGTGLAGLAEVAKKPSNVENVLFEIFKLFFWEFKILKRFFAAGTWVAWRALERVDEQWWSELVANWAGKTVGAAFFSPFLTDRCRHHLRSSSFHYVFARATSLVWHHTCGTMLQVRVHRMSC